MVTRIIAPKCDYSAMPQNDLERGNRAAADTAARMIFRAFDWDSTVEGEPFWQSVHDRLDAISKGELLK